MKKDPKKVEAGRKGGRVSGANFKNNRDLAIIAGQKSAFSRAIGKLELANKRLSFEPLEGDNGGRGAYPDNGIEPRKRK